MGAGNSSISNLSVYQSALTNIGQNLQSKAANINQQTANANQQINFTNGTGAVDPCNRTGARTDYIAKCQTGCDFLKNDPTK